MAGRAFISNVLGIDGTPESGALINSFVLGTSTRSPLYSTIDVSLGTGTPTTNPYVCDSLGQAVFYFDTAISYEWRATTSNGAVTLWEAEVVGGILTLTFTHPDYTVFPIIDLSAVRSVPTYAALTALTSANGLIDGAVFCTKALATTDDGGFGHWRYDAASTTTANGGTVLAIDGGGAGRFFRLGIEGWYVPTEWFGAQATVASDQYPAINAAYQFCKTRGYGAAVLPGHEYSGGIRIDTGLLIDASNTGIVGRGVVGTPNIGVQGGGLSRLRWYGSVGGTMVTVAAPISATGNVILGAECEGIEYDGGLTAATGLKVTSVRFAKLKHHHVEQVTVTAFLTNCREAGELADQGDNQHNEIAFWTWNLGLNVASQAAHGITIDGGFGNTSYQRFVECGGRVHNGHGYWVKDGDNLQFEYCTSFVTGSGKDWSIEANGTYGTVAAIRGVNCQANAGIDIKGAQEDIIFEIDESNGSVSPTTTGSARLNWSNLKNYQAGETKIGLEVGEGASTAAAARAARSSSVSAYLWNNSDAGYVLATSSGAWLLTPIGTGGHLRISRLSGSGELQLPATEFSGATANTVDTLFGNILQRNNDGAAGSFFQTIHNSASPAANDTIGGLQMDGKDSAGNAKSYGAVSTVIDDPTSASEDSHLSFATAVAGAFAGRGSIGAGLYMTGATGGDKGAGTGNFTACYDDNVLLTDLVLDLAVDGKFDTEVYGAHPVAAELKQWWFDPDIYAHFWREHRHLPGMKQWQDPANRPGMGESITRLTAVVEAQAVLIDQLNRRLKALEAGNTLPG